MNMMTCFLSLGLLIAHLSSAHMSVSAMEDSVSNLIDKLKDDENLYVLPSEEALSKVIDKAVGTSRFNEKTGLSNELANEEKYALGIFTVVALAIHDWPENLEQRISENLIKALLKCATVKN